MFTPGHYVTAELRTKDIHRIAETKAALGELCAATLGQKFALVQFGLLVESG